ncbi:MAG: hypothetical protein KF805_00785 [Phycisphaeraceae bacterium]|nr:hypothetical protein [Phycisphaeraceae bacterium]
MKSRSFAALFPLLASALASAQHYSLRMIEPIPDRSHDQSYANGVDAAGNAVGGSFSSTNATVGIGLVRLVDGSQQAMGTLADCFPYGGSGISAVSPGGKIAATTSSICGGFSFAATGSVLNPAEYVTYGPLPGGGDCAAYDANEDSVVGWSNLATGCGGFLCIQTTARAMKWPANGPAIELPISNFVVAIASGVNPAGTIVGRAYTASDSTAAVAVRWDSDFSVPTTLPAVNGTFGDAEKISDSGVVVGQSAVGAERHATLWNGTSPVDLGTLPGDAFSIAYDVDDYRGIVGYSKLNADATASTAVLWRDGQTLDLNTLLTDAGGVVLTSANGINSNGWIAANGIYEGKVRGFILVPCPGDLNGDDVVDDADFSIFVFAYNTLDCADPAMPPGCPSDLNRDGFADDSDFVLFVAAYNQLLCP